MQSQGAITPVNTIADRLIHARSRANLTQEEVATRAHVSQGTIGNIESGIRKNPRELLAIAAAVGVRPEWLKSGSPPMVAPAAPIGGILQEKEATYVAHGASHREPIIALRTVTREGLGVEKFEEPFQMRIDTDELAPDVPRGRIGRFRPGEPPQPGWPVLLRDPEGGFHLRLYRAGIGGDWEGYSKQPEFKTYEKVKHGVEIVATMIGSDWA